MSDPNISDSKAISESDGVQSKSDAFSSTSEYIQIRNELISSSIGSFTGYLTAHPFDTLKTRVQVQGHLYTNSFDCLTKTIKTEGVLGLYKGFLSPCLGQIATNILLFPIAGFCNRICYEYNNTFYPDHDQFNLSYSQLALSGAVAGTAAMISTQPTELVKSILQVQNSGIKKTDLPKRLPANMMVKRWTNHGPLIGAPNYYYGSVDATVMLYKKHGLVKGLGRGSLVTWLRDLSYGVYFVSYEAIRRTFDNVYDQNNEKKSVLDYEYPMWQNFIAGAGAGCFTWASTFPLDVVTSRIRCMPEAEFSKPTPSWTKMLVNIYKNEGFRKLWSGLGVNCVRTIPLTGTLMVTIELVQDFLHEHF